MRQVKYCNVIRSLTNKAVCRFLPYVNYRGNYTSRSKVKLTCLSKTRKIHFLLTFFTVLLLSNNCSRNNKNSSVINHPVREYIPHKEKIIPTKTSATNNAHHSQFLSKLNKADRLFSIGSNRGKRVEVLGDVTALAIDSSQNIYLLDQRTSSIKKYNSKGKLLSIFGGKQGRGPSDLFRPTDIEIGKNGKIYIADAFNYIKILKSTNNGIEYSGAFPTPEIIPTDICILNDKIYIRTLSQNKNRSDSLIFNLVHVYSLKNKNYEMAFGDLYNSPRTRGNNMLSGGLYPEIACLESSETIVYTFEHFNFVYGYTPNGKLKWISELTPFNSREIIETVKREKDIKWEFKGNGAKVTSAFSLGPKSLLVQAVSNSKDDNTIMSSYIINPNTGDGFYFGDFLPWIIEINDDYVYVKNIGNNVSVDVLQLN